MPGMFLMRWTWIEGHEVKGIDQCICSGQSGGKYAVQSDRQSDLPFPADRRCQVPDASRSVCTVARGNGRSTSIELKIGG